jgi:hypothetical protein
MKMRELAGNIRPIAARMFGFDLRSLAAFRIALGALILYDLLSRSADLAAHYTDEGVLPRDLHARSLTGRLFLSLHLLRGDAGFQGLLFGIAALLAVSLLLGYRTRWATFLSWALLLSLHARNPLVNYSADSYLQCILFWSMFLPLGARFSLDVRSGRERGGSTTAVCTIGTVGYCVQTVLVYWLAVIYKLRRAEWTGGTAVYHALHMEQYARPLGERLLHFTPWLPLLTYAVLLFEAAGPLLLCSPISNRFCRLSAMVGFFLMHASFAVCLTLGIFPWVSGVALLPFLPFPGHGQEAEVASPAAERGTAHPWISRAAGLTGGAFLIFIVFASLSDLGILGPRIRLQVKRVAPVLGFSQDWSMFAHDHLLYTGWWVIPGLLKNGKEVDLFTLGGEVRWEKPVSISRMYRNERWTSYACRLLRMGRINLRRGYADYICRQWNADHPGEESLEKMEFFFMEQRIRPDAPPDDPAKHLLLEYVCRPASG